MERELIERELTEFERDLIEMKNNIIIKSNSKFLKKYFNILPAPDGMKNPEISFETNYHNVEFNPPSINNFHNSFPINEISMTFPVLSKFIAGKDMPAPAIPLLLMDTHFETNSPIESLIEIISQFLNEYDGLSNEFIKGSCEWNVIYYCGTNLCKFQIHIYGGRLADNFIVEGNRLYGDAFVFRKCFDNLKNIFEK
jgi:hypothetical protein